MKSGDEPEPKYKGEDSDETIDTAAWIVVGEKEGKQKKCLWNNGFAPGAGS